MKNILTIVGARPQFVKAAVVSAAIQQNEALNETLVHTGQHYDAQMSDVFFDELGIPTPKISLNVGSGSHGHQTAAMLAGLEKTMMERTPDWILVYGDTNSTLAGALAAAKLHIPIAHVEAGLRSYNRSMPEEVNRILTDHVSSLLFTPNDASTRNLHQEGISKGVHQVGDVMYDTILRFRSAVRSSTGILEKLNVASADFVLVTIHRAENTDNKNNLSAIIDALGELVSEGLKVIFPLHPRTLAALASFDLSLSPNISTCKPLGYFEMMSLESEAKVIITDSGGVQKEAFFHKVPCVTLREETEWGELVESNWNCLCPPRTSRHIVSSVLDSIGRTGDEISPYGDGNSSDKIANILMAEN